MKKNTTVYIGGVYENDGSTITKYYFAGGERIAMRKGSTLYFLTSDQLGGTGLVTNSSGAMVSLTRYYPYGGVRTQDGTSPTDKRFTGQQQETPQIYNYKARMYNTDLGRMPQADDLVACQGDPQSHNRYSYVSNDPTNRIDPTGHYGMDLTGWWQLIPTGGDFTGLPPAPAPAPDCLDPNVSNPACETGAVPLSRTECVDLCSAVCGSGCRYVAERIPPARDYRKFSRM